jgi:hypothetical protein
MPPTALLHGPAIGRLATLPGALADAGFTLALAAPASLLITLGGPAGPAIAAAEAFATAPAPTLIIHLLPEFDPNHWPDLLDRTTLWAHTRHAALAWAPRGIRVNAIGLGASPLLADQSPEASGQPAGAAPAPAASGQDIVATILAMWAFSSMTGQLIRLGA